ncbi:hypothetical protein [Sphingomonas sp. URHD0057]|uniref:hypothetical protein n=1 Tax=Sphingomonas sp. URHD0057 TaxID=1380389 RepID=UPI00048DE8B9|nr:hypothetical protein [Sphingomonas sp. URHD0057]
MAVIRLANILCGTLLFLGALVAVGFLPDKLISYSQEPEDVWAIGLTAVLCGSFAALCLANASRSNARFGWRTPTNLVAVIALAVLFVLGRDDRTVPPLLTLCAVGPVAALIGAWIQRLQQS